MSKEDLILDQTDKIVRNAVTFNPDKLTIEIILDKATLDLDTNGARVWAKFTKFAKDVGEALRPVVQGLEENLEEDRATLITLDKE